MNLTPMMSPPGVLLLARLLVAGDKGEKRDKLRKELGGAGRLRDDWEGKESDRATDAHR